MCSGPQWVVFFCRPWHRRLEWQVQCAQGPCAFPAACFAHPGSVWAVRYAGHFCRPNVSNTLLPRDAASSRGRPPADMPAPSVHPSAATSARRLRPCAWGGAAAACLASALLLLRR